MLNVCPDCRNFDVEKTVNGETAGEGVAFAECHECGHEFQFPYLPLFTLEGAPSVGKSTTAGLLWDDLPLTVWEDDLLIDLLGGNVSWSGICELGFRICMTIHRSGDSALKVGGLYPHDLSDSPETRYFSRIERCALVAEDDDYEARLRDRPFFQSHPDKIEEHSEYNQWYRERAPKHDITVINTTDLSPNTAASRVRTWIENNR